MQTNILHNSLPKQAIAQWSPMDGRAIIELPDGRVYSYDPKCQKDHRLKHERIGFHPGMWLQPALAAQCGFPIEERPAGEYPFSELLEYIAFRLRVKEALDAFLLSLDSDLEAEFRRKMARKATRLLEEDAVRQLVEPVLLHKPMQEGFDSRHGPSKGHAGRILKEMTAR